MKQSFLQPFFQLLSNRFPRIGELQPRVGLLEGAVSHAQRPFFGLENLFPQLRVVPHRLHIVDTHHGFHIPQDEIHGHDAVRTRKEALEIGERIADRHLLDAGEYHLVDRLGELLVVTPFLQVGNEPAREFLHIAEHDLRKLFARNLSGDRIGFEHRMHRDHLLALLGRDDQLLGVDRLPEHLFGNTGGRIDVDRHIHRTGEFRREAVDSLDLLEHHAEIDHVHPVVKPFDAELHHVEHRHLLAWHGIFAQRRGKDRSLYLQRIGGSRVVKHLDAMAAYEGLDAVYPLILPNYLITAFNIMLVKNYYQNSIPDALIEAAEIDGASELTIFWKIVFPLSTPVIATISLFTALKYWNDWVNALYYITKPQLYGIQNLLLRIMDNIQFLKSGGAGEIAGAAMVDLPGTSVRMAMAVVGILPIILIYPFVQKYFIKGVVVGAVKG